MTPYLTLGDPIEREIRKSLKSLLAQSNAIASHADAIAINLEESSKQMPLIAADVERIAATSSRYRKAILLSQILSALVRAFF